MKQVLIDATDVIIKYKKLNTFANPSIKYRAPKSSLSFTFEFPILNIENIIIAK